MTQPLLIIPTKRGFAAVTLPQDVLAKLTINMDQMECFESLGGRYSYDGVIHAVLEHFTPKVEPVEPTAVAAEPVEA